MPELSSNRTIAKNTILLYIRMAITMAVLIYTSRVVLRVLGVEDDGIYNIVGGAAGIFSFLNGALSGATSRFLTFEIGKGNKESLKKTFSAALEVHIILSVIIVILLETVGLWLLNNKLVIPDERMHAARVVYHLSVAAMLLSITQVPYSASLIAHEKMGIYAYMSILEVSLKLLICYLIQISPYDKLITYGVLVLSVNTLMRIIYRVYCIRKFEECHFEIVTDKTIFKPILSFSGWSLLGSLSGTALNQGVSIIQNMFFGPTINSASGKAGTVFNVVNSFYNNFLTAVKPSIVKSYAIGDIKRMEELLIASSKYAYSLMMLFSVPFFFESKFIIDLWLVNPPEYAPLFCSVNMGLGLFGAIFYPLSYAISATGEIKLQSIIESLLWIAVVPISYLLFLAGSGPVIPYLVKLSLWFFVIFTDFYVLKRNIPEFHQGMFLRKAILPSFISAAISMAVTAVVYYQFDGPSWWRFLTVCVTSTLIVSSTVFYIVFDKQMRETVLSKIKLFLKTGRI